LFKIADFARLQILTAKYRIKKSTKNVCSVFRSKHEDETVELETLSRISELKELGQWMNSGDHRKLIFKSEDSQQAEDLKRKAIWSNVIQEASEFGKKWTIERKYRRILTKKFTAGVRKAVKEKVIIIWL
jgi:hypothetical protein